MAKPVEYQLVIESNDLGTLTQIWRWHGEKKGDLKALRNDANYASDTRIFIDKNNKVSGGYCYLINPSISIEVTRISA